MVKYKVMQGAREDILGSERAKRERSVLPGLRRWRWRVTAAVGAGFAESAAPLDRVGPTTEFARCTRDQIADQTIVHFGIGIVGFPLRKMVCEKRRSLASERL